MAPGSAKRKRPDRGYSQDEGAGRPSPHRPEHMSMAQRAEGGGGARTGRGGRESRRQSRQGGHADGANAVPVTPRSAASPPAQQVQPQTQRNLGTPAADISRTSTPVARSGTPAQPPTLEASKEPPPPSVPYAYEHVTDEVVQSWQTSGSQAIMTAARDADDLMMNAILQELVRSALDNRLDATEAGSGVKQMIADKGEDMDVAWLFLNTISLLDEAEHTNSALLRLVAATDIDPETIRTELDQGLLQSLGLVRSTFTRVKTRKTTNMLYRQANYNLLREETEGYAKLLTEYFNIAEDASGNRVISTEMAEDAFQRIKALVGAFDLDPGRVLDITLDISANALVKAFGFFIKFYRCSSWWPDDGLLDNVKWEQDEGPGAFPAWALPGYSGNAYAEEGSEELAALKKVRDEKFFERLRDQGMDAFFQLNARRIVDYDSVAELLNTEVPETRDGKNHLVNEEKRQRINENRKYMRETHTLPPSGNSDAAQLLGFKLSFYASPARDAADTVPENLIHFTALLIKIGFVSLRDIYPHLYPPDEKMAEEKTRLEKEKAEKEAKERPGGGPNALAMASVLTDDTVPVTARRALDKDRSGGATPKSDKKEEEEKQLPTPANQKLWLLKALLAHGDLPDALYILGRYPWLVDVDPDLPRYLNRIVRHMLSKVAQTAKPLADRAELSEARDQLSDTAPGPDSMLRFGSRPSKRPPQRWLALETISEREGSSGRYYYTDWVDTVPVCRTLDDVLLLCNTFIPLLGVKIGHDHVVLGTLVRLARKNLAEDGSEANRTKWLELMRRLLVPALSLTKHNPSLTDEVYQLLMFFPITTRYDLYADWFGGRTSRLPDIAAAFSYNRAEIKEVIRRVSNENAKMQARSLGKVLYSSPGVPIMFMINQLESYSNMIPALVECTKHFPPLAYDVMIWCLIKALSGQGRDRMQADGMLTSSWLQALSQFVASLFSHYSGLNPSPILQYLAAELRNGDSTNLEMFDQVLAEMAGIRSDTEFNDAQVLAMCGGEQLQTQVVQQLADTRHQCKSGAQRLIKALAEPGLIGQTLIAIAQERQMYSHHDSAKFMPLKVLGNNLDKIQQVFAQYLDVLKTNLKPEDFEQAVPDVVSLIADFGLKPSLAFTICRGAIGHRMNEYDESKRQQEQEQKEQKKSISRNVSNSDVEMAEPDVKPAVNGGGASPASDGGEAVEEDEAKPSVANAESQEAPEPAQKAIVTGDESPWHPVLEPIIERLRAANGNLDQRVKTPFFVTFWTLAHTDVIVNTDSYHQEIERIQGQVNEISRNRTDKSSTAIEMRERRKKQLTEIQNKLRTEVKGRINSYTSLSNRLSRSEKHHWFERSRQHADLDSRHINLLQECFLPRAMLSALDAHYSYLMLKMLHDKGAPGFSTLHLLQQLFRKQELCAIIYQCTALEAQHFGRFLNETLKLAASWHGSKKDYEKNALGGHKLPGFVTKMDDQNDALTWTFMDFEMFRRLVYNWHSTLASTMQLCFDSSEYMHIRNGIIVLKAIVQVFPAINFHGKNMLKLVEKVSQEDDRQDLKLMALSLRGPLKTREAKWVMPQAFRLNDPAKEGKPSSRAASARPETPQPGTGTPKLNASAPEFKPQLANGTRTSSGAGIEDGEVEEEKQAIAKTADTEMEDAGPLKREEEGTKVEKPVTDEKEGPADKSSEFTRAPRATPAGLAKDQQHASSKPSTPAPTGPRSQAPGIDDEKDHGSRPQSTQPGPSRPGYDLPSRPDSRPSRSSQPLGPPPVARPSETRPSRGDERFGRLDRPSEVRPSREPSPGQRSRGRTPPGAGRGAPRSERMRDARDDGYPGPRRDAPSTAMHAPSSESRDRANGFMAPSGDRSGHIPSVSSSSQAPPPTRPASVAQTPNQPPTSDVNLDPARRALIEAASADGPPSREREARHAEKDRRREKEARSDRESGGYHQAADMRPNGRGGPMEPPREPHSTRRGDPAPAGPKHGRPGRDLNREMGPPQSQQESSYGRLSQPPEPSSGPPAGPRAPNGLATRGGRNFNGLQPPANVRNEPPLPSPSVPESPAAFRQPGRQQPERRSSGQHYQLDRLPPAGAPAGSANSQPVNPIRAQMFQQPPQLQTNVPPANGNSGASSPTSGPPSGPRGVPGRAPAGAPSGPSPVTNGPPTGPGGRRDRHLQNLNSHMQPGTPQGGGRGSDVSFRGAANNRQNSFGMPSAASGPNSQALASPMEPPPRRGEMGGPPSRPDSRAEPRQDLFQQGAMPEGRDDGRPRRREDERGERHRNSRHPSGERRRDDEAPQRPPPPGMEDGRDKRSGRDDRRGRDEHGRREGGREPRGPRGDDGRRPQEMLGQYPGPPQPMGPPDWARDDGRGGRRDRGPHRGEDVRGGRREDDRRAGGPPRDDGSLMDGRKRGRHEDPSFEGNKRRRPSGR